MSDGYEYERDGVLDIGFATLPQGAAGKAARLELLGERGKGLKGGEYRIFAHVKSGRVDPKLVTLLKDKGEHHYDVCTDVSLANLAAKPNILTLRQQHVTFDPQAQSLSVGDAFVREATVAVQHMAEDAIIPGLSIISRIGEMATLLSDRQTITGTYRGRNGSHDIVEGPDGKLHACDYGVGFKGMKDGDAIMVTRDGDEQKVERGAPQRGERSADVALEGAELARILF